MNYAESKDTNINVINLLLLPGLLAIVLLLITDRLSLMLAVVAVPFLLILMLQILRIPITMYFSIFTLNYFILGLSRYTLLPGTSFFMDILIHSTMILIFLHTALSRSIEWKHVFNSLTIGFFFWMIYCLAEIYNPSGMVKAWVLSRGLVINGFIISLLVSLLFDKYKWIKLLIGMYAVFTLIGVAKAVMQKSFGFDWAEVLWLNKGGYKTHLISTGTRYFSFFSDAGNMGSNMGCAAVVFFIATLYIRNIGLKLFYLFVGFCALYAMFLSGTRGAMIVPLAGLALFAIVSKNYKLLISSGAALILIYVFFAHTMIGQSNQQIRRMRTAFNPTEDGSFNVRLENQRILAAHLKNKPFGEGLGLSGVENQDISMRLTTQIPHDSWYVKIWVETGVVGITLYLLILFIVVGRGTWILMFRVKNRELKGYLAGLLCGIFGMLISAYGNAFWGQYPTNIIAFTGLALVLKAEHFEKELSKQ
ncbi:O-antigen ligase family protein [Parabacteroides sp. OttesenSCG-928-N08]|nr:O-antigen ligase family protein [Parabacteroides sp. OttesenSCG-928-N08]